MEILRRVRGSYRDSTTDVDNGSSSSSSVDSRQYIIVSWDAANPATSFMTYSKVELVTGHETVCRTIYYILRRLYNLHYTGQNSALMTCTMTFSSFPLREWFALKQNPRATLSDLYFAAAMENSDAFVLPPVPTAAAAASSKSKASSSSTSRRGRSNDDDVTVSHVDRTSYGRMCPYDSKNVASVLPHHWEHDQVEQCLEWIGKQLPCHVGNDDAVGIYSQRGNVTSLERSLHVIRVQ